MKRSRNRKESAESDDFRLVDEQTSGYPLINIADTPTTHDWPSPNVEAFLPTISLDPAAQESLFRIANSSNITNLSMSYGSGTQTSKRDLDDETSNPDSEELNRRKLRNLREKSRAQKVKEKINTLSDHLTSKGIAIGKSKHSVLDATIAYINKLEARVEHDRKLDT